MPIRRVEYTTPVRGEQRVKYEASIMTLSLGGERRQQRRQFDTQEEAERWYNERRREVKVGIAATPRASKVREDEGWVYLMVVRDGRYKIGESVNPERRISGIRTVLPAEIVFKAYVAQRKKIEADLKHEYAAKCDHGEFFNFNYLDVAQLAQRFHYLLLEGLPLLKLREERNAAAMREQIKLLDGMFPMPRAQGPVSAAGEETSDAAGLAGLSGEHGQ